MITIARFSKPEDAHLLRLRLEAGGVPAYIQDENMVQMDWLYSNAIGGVRVQVSDADLDDAREILQEPPGEDVSADLPACPACSSLQTAPDELPPAALLPQHPHLEHSPPDPNLADKMALLGLPTHLDAAQPSHAGRRNRTLNA